MRRPMLLAASALLCGCASEPADPGPAGRFAAETHRLAHRDTHLVLVVDDEPTPRATSLRASLPEVIRGALRRARGEPFDPAMGVRLGWRLTVAWPSAGVGERFVTVRERPGLAIDRLPTNDVELDLATAALADVLAAPPVPKAPYAPIALVAEIAAAAAEDTLVLVATTRDDAHGITRKLDANVEAVLVTSGRTCGSATTFPRLAALAPTMLGSSCPDLRRHGPWPMWVDTARPCLGREILEDDDGPRCLVEVERRGPCEASRGEEPLTPPSDDGARACRVRPLSGEAKVACETSLACEGCGAGYCVTRVRELLMGCADPRVRLVGDASYDGDVVRWTCAVRTPSSSMTDG